jgi:glutathione peroxidase
VNVFDFTARSLTGEERPLAEWRGQVLLLVNVASECGFTPQYTGLEKLYRRHKDAGFAVLGFPCDQFGHQEPGNEAAIGAFCSDNYDVTFPMFAKIEVNGPGTHPLYRHLKSARRGIAGTTAVKWNFTKFLVDRRGEVVQRFAPSTTPQQIEGSIVPLLEGIAPNP